MPRRTRPHDPSFPLVLAIGFLVLLSGCVDSADRGPELSNQPPYWCELVSKRALAEVQGFDEATQRKLAERADGRILDTDYFGCKVEDVSDSRWGFHLEALQSTEIDKKLKIISTRFEYDRVIELPSDLGDGGASLTTGWVRWGCNDKETLLYIVLQRGADNPDEPEPLVMSTLRVMQERYAQLAKCSVKPPPEKAS